MADANADAATPLRVLLVDDSPWLRQRVRAALERAGLVVVGEAADGAQALTQAAAHHPDLVLMDLCMPGMDGIQATQGRCAGSSQRSASCCGPGGTTHSSPAPCAGPEHMPASPRGSAPAS